MTTYKQELDLLRARGYEVGPPDSRTGRVPIWMPGSADTVDVCIGRELEEFAAGKLTFGDIRERREDEIVIEER